MANRKKLVIRTAAEAKADLERHGISIAQWAREHGLDRATVYQVLHGRPARIGKSHKAAVLLGLKDGLISS